MQTYIKHLVSLIFLPKRIKKFRYWKLGDNYRNLNKKISSFESLKTDCITILDKKFISTHTLV